MTMTASEMITVQGLADDSLVADFIAERKRSGLDRFDEWWEGVYRVVTGPRPDHGMIVAELCAMFLPLCKERGLSTAATLNIGVDGWNARVPDIGVFRPDVNMTSPAFASTAELVVEVLSPREAAGEKLPFYAESGIAEYLEVDLPNGACRLLALTDGRWAPVTTSDVLGFELADIAALLDG